MSTSTKNILKFAPDGDGRGRGAAESPRMPVLFLGHGSPMNALDDDGAFARAIGDLGRRLPRPRAVLAVSAHWIADGTRATAMERPRTIHDFHGFPEELYRIQYPAPGDAALARRIAEDGAFGPVALDSTEWGLDHGTWSVLMRLFPEADVPVVQLSLDAGKSPRAHFELGRELAKLRDEGILIVGSGNVVHNLRMIRWRNDAPAYDWAIEFDEWLKGRLEARDFASALESFDQTAAGRLAVPTLDHYLPLHYALGASREDDALRFEFEGLQNASISMRCVSFGLGGAQSP